MGSYTFYKTEDKPEDAFISGIFGHFFSLSGNKHRLSGQPLFVPKGHFLSFQANDWAESNSSIDMTLFQSN